MRSAHWTLICIAIVMLVLTRVGAPPAARSASSTFIGSLQGVPPANLVADSLSDLQHHA